MWRGSPSIIPQNPIRCKRGGERGLFRRGTAGKDLVLSALDRPKTPAGFLPFLCELGVYFCPKIVYTNAYTMDNLGRQALMEGTA